MTAAIALRIDRNVLLRGAIAGTAWGLAMSAGLSAMAFSACGIPCPDDIAVNTAVCVAAGLVTIGPLAMFRKPAAS